MSTDKITRRWEKRRDNSSKDDQAIKGWINSIRELKP